MSTDKPTRRQRIARAKAAHPAYWNRPDLRAIQTAQAFHYSSPPRVDPSAPWLVASSRPRRARWHNRAAVAVLMLASVLLGAIVYAASARADGAVDAWTAEYGPAACDFLGEHATLDGLSGVIVGAQQMGLSPRQAGEAVATAVLDVCPQFTPLLREFVRRYGPVVTA